MCITTIGERNIITYIGILDTVCAIACLSAGDIARVDKDGFLYIVDRLKELIKYKGNQVLCTCMFKLQ